ncbi:MAG: EamA family transporter [Rhizobiales bacterium]|nr:EamA family transporter [Hyphomicrobiales bacterium]
MQAARTMDGQDWALLVLLSVLWGGAFFFSGIAVRELPPLTVVLARVFFAGLTLLPVFWLLGHRLPTSVSGWRPFVGMGLLNNVLPFSLIFAGQTYIPSGLASIVNATTPLFTVLVMAAFAEERLTGLRVCGVLLGLVGVAVLKGFSANFENAEFVGILLCLAGAASYGFAGLWARRNLGGVPPLKSATCQLISSSVIIAIVACFVDRPWALAMPGTATLLSLLALAVFGTAAAYVVFFRIIGRAGASNAMLVTLLIPVSALALGIAFLDEPIRERQIAGALVIALGLLFIDGRIPLRVMAWRVPRQRR